MKPSRFVESSSLARLKLGSKANRVESSSEPSIIHVSPSVNLDFSDSASFELSPSQAFH